ncbi:gastrokine-1-like [Myiozetetes cayanensis]|uniref:gastrokine-1-like n=1 Tax=Myiozetetes cayanensis TaxID=478635 RepID=UPI00215E7923|nr:gastrokine-1-like [Myiozetetes cayanensis]
MKFTIVIAALLGVVLAPALANKNTDNGHHSENSNRSDSGISTDPKEGSEGWKTVWDFKTGYVATKVFSKNTCIIASTSRRFWLGKQFPTPPPGDTVGGWMKPHPLPSRENRFLISRHRLQSLSPYGKRIQALCRGIPSYLAYPAPGSNFLRGSNFSGSNFLERRVS